MEEEKEISAYYLAIQENGETILYKSEKFRLLELDLINLIKICFVQRRAVSVGQRILAVYLDSQRNNKEKATEILKKIGVKQENNEPIKSKKIKNR